MVVAAKTFSYQGKILLCAATNSGCPQYSIIFEIEQVATDPAQERFIFPVIGGGKTDQKTGEKVRGLSQF